jgi:hypothetical protein
MAAIGFTGAGATITFGTNTYSAKIRSIGKTEQNRGKVDSTTLDVASASFAKCIPADNPDPGETEVVIRWVGATAPPVFAAPETITITLPKEVAASSSGATFGGTGFLMKRVGAPNLQRSGLNEGGFTIAWNGDTGPTYTVEA